MVKVVKKKAGWKPVRIEGGFTDLDGLIGLEELTEYDEAREAPKKRKLSVEPLKKKKKKRKKSTGTKDKNGFIETELIEDVERNVDTLDLLPWTSICLPEELSNTLVQLGFTVPTEIQRLSIPAAVNGRRDILGAAETGSGKTLAFGLPMIYGIMKCLEENEETAPEQESDDNEEENVAEDSNCVKVVDLGVQKREHTLYGLVVTPTRELAIQIEQHLTAVVKNTQIRVAVIVGGMSMEKQTRVLSKGPHIVVGTPGRLWELITTGNSHLSQVNRIRYLAIDETDRMIERDHYPELRSLLELINADPELAKRRQNFVFSATLTLVHEVPSYVKLKKRKKSQKKALTPEQKLNDLIALVGMTNYKVVDVTRKSGTASNLKEAKISCSFEEKDFYLYYLLSVYKGRTLVFCNSISSVRRLASVLTCLQRAPIPLHANMQQRQRLKNLDKFKELDNAVLLATDVAARGLDIPLVKHVIHYQVPRTSEGYVHRSGRTARADQSGLTVLLVEPGELKFYTRICTNLERTKDLEEFPVESIGLAKAKERVKLARDIDAICLKVKKTQSKSSWVEKAAEEMDIVLDDDQRPHQLENDEIAAAKRLLKEKRLQLDALLKNSMGRPTVEAVDLVGTQRVKAKKKVKMFKNKKIAINQ